jgi:hypothetical protein
MKKQPFFPSIMTSLSALLIGQSLAATPIDSHSAAATKPALELSAAMAAASAHPSVGDQAQIFGRLVGAWDVEYMDIVKNGKKLERTGLFIAGWVMDGRAIQDLWVVDPSPGHAEREVYSDLRYFVPKTRSWTSIFVDPEHASMARFSGDAAADGRIVLHTSDLGSKENRWSFDDIQPNSFVFRDEASADDGKTWKLLAEYHMTRRSAVTRP